MITKEFFDKYNGQDIFAYTLTDGISVTVLNLGATVTHLKVPSANGNLIDVALAMTNASDVANNSGYLGSVVGRCGNRIGNGKFTLQGKNYQLDLNDNGKAHLHGGKNGWNKKVYRAEVQDNSLIFYFVSPDGDNGYVGKVDFCVKYTVQNCTLSIEYFASTDKTTLLNPTNHLYFNLNGQDDGSILDNFLQLNAEEFLAVDNCLIPTSKLSVKNTPFDFTVAKQIGQDIAQNHSQLVTAGGYDHNFCLKDCHFARAYSTKTGIVMDCYTDLCGVQFYSGNFLDGLRGKSLYNKNSGFCLETQFWPDAINNPHFAQPILHPDEKFYSKTQYVFDILK